MFRIMAAPVQPSVSWPAWLAKAHDVLDRFAVNIGTHRFSVLDILVFVIVAVTIYGIARLAFRITQRLIRKNNLLEGTVKLTRIWFVWVR